MRKLLSTLLSAAIIYAIPAQAEEPLANSEDQVLPDVVAPQEEAIQGQGDDQASAEQHYRRYCPWGYHLVAYRIRIGRFYVVRYYCVRNHYPGYPRYPGYPGYPGY